MSVTDDLDEFAAEIADQVRSFVVAVREVASGETPETAVSMLLLEISQLMLAGGRLGAISDVVPQERFEPDPGREADVDGVRSSLANLLEPIDEYVEVFDPYEQPPQLLVQRLSDDIAGVLADLSHGLAHFDNGRAEEALWWWQFSYLSSWGGTASAALRALQSIVAHVRLDPDEADEELLAEDQPLAETVAQAHSVD
ncbi:MAG: DUF5063 domain-containing protein [Actinomycetes bacterium]